MYKTAYRWILLCCALFPLAACPSSSTPAPIPTPTGDGGGRLPPNQWRAAVGAEGAFTQTFDEKTWQARRVATGDLYAVACVGNLLGWLAGADGFVARTKDGGATLHTVATGISAHLRAIRFADTLNGVLAGDAGTLAVSNDGGEHFRVIPRITTRGLRGVAFAGAAGLVLAVGESGVVLRSLDVGNSFTELPAFTSADLTAVASDATGSLIVVVDSAGGIWSSRDRATSFNREATAPAALSAISLAAPFALAVGENGTLMLRHDGGKWTTASVEETAGRVNLNAALLTYDGGFAYLAGAGGTLLRSADFGGTWQLLESGTTATLYGLEDL